MRRRLESHPGEMNAVVIHQYGGPEVLKYEDFANPVAGPGEVLVRTSATSINPVDYMRRSGAGILGVDLSDTVVGLGAGAEGFSVGDKVFGMADKTYAEFCVVKAANLARVPDGIDPVEAAAPACHHYGEPVDFRGHRKQAG